MKIDDQLIRRLETLARLKLCDDERRRIASDLQDILSMIDKINEVDLDHVEALRQISPAQNRWRDDIPREHIDRDQALGNAPKSEDPYFSIPKVVKK